MSTFILRRDRQSEPPDPDALERVVRWYRERALTEDAMPARNALDKAQSLLADAEDLINARIDKLKAFKQQTSRADDASRVSRKLEPGLRKVLGLVADAQAAVAKAADAYAKLGTLGDEQAVGARPPANMTKKPAAKKAAKKPAPKARPSRG